jgi:DNA-binding PadR family transcriptional regulator
MLEIFVPHSGGKVTTQSKRDVRRHNRELSELEGVVLGLLSLSGRATAYSIRTTLLNSPNSRWSGSAGAIYPLMRRLEARDLCISNTFKTGKRPGKKYELTGKGRECLRRWLGPPLTKEAIDLLSDPIRTRLSFIFALSKNDQRKFLSEAKSIIQSHVVRSEGECKRNRETGNTEDFLISRGALLLSRARLEWIEEVEKQMSGRE